MNPYRNAAEELKQILEKVCSPDRLDNHPWTNSLAVQEEMAQGEASNPKNPGYHLLSVLGRLFCQMMPSTPPRQGKRLDTRWCEFGMLAAQYFGPFLHGSVYPASLRDAGGRIDQAISLFVFNQPLDIIPPVERSRYSLIGGEIEPMPMSTLSNWQTRGLEKLAKLFFDHEQYLSHNYGKPSSVLHPGRASEGHGELLLASPKKKPVHKPRRTWIRAAGYFLSFFAIVVVLFAGYQTWLIYQLAQNVREDYSQMEEAFDTGLSPEMITEIGPLLTDTKADLEELQRAVQPYLWLSHGLGWVPVYGGDLANFEGLLKLGIELVNSAEVIYQGVLPVWQSVSSSNSSVNISEMTELLVEAQPRLVEARSALDLAIIARSEIDTRRLSPGLRSLIENKIDTYLMPLSKTLEAAIALPGILGAGDAGPQTYMILVQNEDELRPTGGFITAVGAVVVRNGDVMSLIIENSGDLDDRSKPYPVAPWQLREYMDSSAWILRDSNWFPDFPTSAGYAEYFYAYSRYHSVDGIVAIDQRMVVYLLDALGPIEVTSDSQLITAQNVIEYLRQAKAEAQQDDIENKKVFIQQLGNAILEKMQSGQGISWSSLLSAVQKGLSEKHLLVQMDDPTMADALAYFGWNGSVQPGDGDFLMVVDSNIGYNKVNAVVNVSLTYAVDLTNISSPTATLATLHSNNAQGSTPCIQWGVESEDYNDLMNRCYWNYLRVYSAIGTQLLDATPHAIPGGWMIRGEDVPAQVDNLLEEQFQGVSAFGTLLVVPEGDAIETSFHFQLPNDVLSLEEDGLVTYKLRIRKQPGTVAHPIHVQIQMPPGARIVDASPAGKLENGTWVLETDLRTDMNIQVTFQTP